MVGFPLEDFVRAVKALPTFFGNKAQDGRAVLDAIVRYAQIARREGIIALEEHVQKATDPFFRKAFLMVVDGIDSKSISETLELEFAELDERGEVPAKVYEAAGCYCPTVGILEWRDLPQEARDYIDFIEQEIEAPVTLVSTGPRREETIVRDHPDLERLTAGRLGKVLEQR